MQHARSAALEFGLAIQAIRNQEMLSVSFLTAATSRSG